MSYSTDEFWREYRPPHQTLLGLAVTFTLVNELLGMFAFSQSVLYNLAGLSLAMIGWGVIRVCCHPAHSRKFFNAMWWCWHWVTVLIVILFFG